MTTKIPRQFASTARLLSQTQFEQLRGAHVGVIGLGGVGSWAAEALVRSGVGALTLVDMDHVAESNLNRQVQALHSTLGLEKIVALRNRLLDIAPDCRIHCVDEFLTPENAAQILSANGAGPSNAAQIRPVHSVDRPPESPQSPQALQSPHTDDTLQSRQAPQIWIDATDDMAAKRAIILVMAAQKRLGCLVVSGGAGGKTDPTRIEAADLSESTQDALLSTLRYDLRKHHAFARQGKMKIAVVFSRQPTLKSDDCDPAAKLACAGYGSMVTVTATMGFVAASLAMQKVTKNVTL
jgi:tRNA threonylcarbamoyladenosine dehydratase